MLFNSYIFILFFLPLTLAGYYGLNYFRRKAGAKIFLFVMSLWFYAYFHLSYLAILLFSILFNYWFSRLLARREYAPALRKALLAAGVGADIAVIFYFKYFDFFLENVNLLFRTNFLQRNILMPLGISFFTFQQISYLVDSYRGETENYCFLDYALFVAFFPQLVAGPIVMHGEMIPQFQNAERKRPDQEYLSRGIWLFSIGMFKKVLLADTLGAGADWAFLNPGLLSASEVAVASLLYAFQIYFDFSGYCDMAGGIASMFHIDLPINFNSPYKALSVEDFWGRWHMSLSGFLRKYVYFPLGGNRKGRVRAWVNIMAVFLVSGIWHGANWTYILWGLMHGAVNVLDHIFGDLGKRAPGLLRRLATFLFVTVAWMLFRAASVADFWRMLTALFTCRAGGIHTELTEKFDIIEFTYLEDHISFLWDFRTRIPGMNMWIVLIVSAILAFVPANCYERAFKPTAGNAVKTVILLVWSILSLSGVSIFLYFNF